MELEVGGEAGAEVLHARAGALEHLRHGGEIRIGPLAGGDPGHLDLDDQAQLHQLREDRRAPPQHQQVLRRDARAVELGDDHPAARPDVDEAALLEQARRLADDRPAHVVLRGELLLGRQPGAGHQPVGDERLLDVVGHQLRKPRRAPVVHGERRAHHHIIG
jgi:hypothetical protein